MKSRVFYRKEPLCISVQYDDSELTFYGQDFGGWANTSEYEYWLSVKGEDLRNALSANADQDLGDLVCQRVDEIMSRGESRWLTEHGIPYKIHNRYGFDDNPAEGRNDYSGAGASPDLAVTGEVSVPADSESSDRLDIVYTESDAVGALFAERETARRAAQIWRAVMRSTTWGEFRKTMPADVWKDVVDSLDEDVPTDDAPFSSDDVPGWGDTYYPGPWPPEDVIDWFPEDLIDKYGGSLSPNPNGLYLYLPVESADHIAAELRARGHMVEQSIDDLPEWIFTCGDSSMSAVRGRRPSAAVFAAVLTGRNRQRRSLSFQAVRARLLR